MTAHLDGWMPVRIAWDDVSPRVEWLRLDQRRFTEPFFDDTVQNSLVHPFHHAFRRSTSLEELESWSVEHPGLPPRGFVFHMSRCGSTLVSQVLASVGRNIVLSEPPPVDSILRAHHRNSAFTREVRARGLRWILSALGQKRHPAEEQVFVKFDCWSIPELAVVREAFPSVPWIFVYRDPIEVLVSQMRQRAQWSVQGQLSPAIFGLPEDLAEVPHDEYCARLLGRICEIALQQFGQNAEGLLVNYSELPDFCFSQMPRHFRMELAAEEIALMRQAAEFNAKSPGMSFAADGESKRNLATDRVRELAALWIEPVYRQLEWERQTHATIRL